MALEARVEDKITCHAWNADRSMLAVCPNNNEVHIFKKPPQTEDTWTRVHILKEHDALVTEIAWAPKTNRILTTAQDRNAYVWTLEGDSWKPMLVILRISSAATSVKWCASPPTPLPRPRTLHPLCRLLRPPEWLERLAVRAANAAVHAPCAWGTPTRRAARLARHLLLWRSPPRRHPTTPPPFQVRG